MLGLTDVISCARTLVLFDSGCCGVESAAVELLPAAAAAAQIMARFVIALGYWMVKKALDHRRSRLHECHADTRKWSGPCVVCRVVGFPALVPCQELCIIRVEPARPNLLLSSPALFSMSPCMSYELCGAEDMGSLHM